MNYLLQLLLENQQLNTKYVKSLFQKRTNSLHNDELSSNDFAESDASFAQYAKAAETVINDINSGTGDCILPKNKDRFKSILIYLALANYKTIFADPSDSNGFVKNFHDAAISSPNAKQFVANFIDKFKLDVDETTPENAIAYCKNMITSNRAKIEKKTQVDEIWTRVKLIETGIKYPGDEYVWVQAVNKNGKPVGFIPTAISNKYMHHCGNEPSVKTGDVYWGLRRRDDITNEVLTVILNNGNIAEAKSYGNAQSKFGKQIYKYVEALYASDYVKGIDERYDYGYSTITNFSVSYIANFDANFLSWCKKNKPTIIGNTEKAILNLKSQYKDKTKLVKAYLSKSNKTNMFTQNHWTVFVSALGGVSEIKNYLSEDDIINKLIATNDLSLFVYANADLSLLTDRIQCAFCKYQHDSFDILLNIMQTVARFYISPKIIAYLCSINKFYRLYLETILPKNKLKYYGNLL